MTLLDAPNFDTAGDRRRRIVIYLTVTVLGAVFGGFWLASGAPFDWPWTWNSHRAGTIAVDQFLRAVDADGLGPPAAGNCTSAAHPRRTPPGGKEAPGGYHTRSATGPWFCRDRQGWSAV